MNEDASRILPHFENREPSVRKIYRSILQAARKFGTVREDPKKTSIHLVRHTAFAGIATRKTGLILTLKSDADVTNKRIARREQASRNRWHLEIRLDRPEEVDEEVIDLLQQPYELAG